MAITRSTGLVNFIATKGSVRQALANSRVKIFQGTIPSGTDAADTGSAGSTELVELALSDTPVPETLPSWRFTMAGVAGTVDSVKIGGVEQLPSAAAYATSLADLATLIVSMINNNEALPDYTAGVVGAGNDEVAIYGPISCGASLNDLLLVSSGSGGITTTDITAGAAEQVGVDAVDCCNWGYIPTTGQISKEATAWAGTIALTGTAQWFMIVTDNDSGTNSSTTARRIIGTVGTTAKDLNLSSDAFTAGAAVTINSWTLTVTR